jgi:hypothetical protein
MAKRCRSCCTVTLPCTLCVRVLGCPSAANLIPGLMDGAVVTLTGPGTITGSPGVASRGVTGVAITAQGTGYSSPTAVSFSGGGGSGAAGTAALINGTIASVPVSAGGSDYTRIPTVTAAGGTGASLAAVLVPTSLDFIDVTSGGSGYTTLPGVTLTPTAGGGSGAAAQAFLVSTSLNTIGVTAGGSGYTSAPSVVIGGGGGATATATVSGGSVVGVTVTGGGSYTSEPPISFSGGGGSGATATASLTPTSVDHVNVTAGGSGYSGATITVGFTGGGGGSGAAATATIVPTSVASVTVVAGGSGYNEGSVVSFSNTGGGSGATAKLLLSNASVSAATITAPGSGYTSVPTPVFTGSGGTGSGATGTATLASMACFGYNTGGTFNISIAPPATTLGARFATTATSTIANCLAAGLTSVSVNMTRATGYRCTRLCDLPFAETLYASTAQGVVTVPFIGITSTSFNTWEACGMFSGGGATVVGGVCTPGAAGNTPFKFTFRSDTAAGGLTTDFVLSRSTCCQGAAPTAVPHFRTDATCASSLIGEVPPAITLVSCDPVHFQVTIPATLTCPGSTPTLAHPMAGTIDITE